jgi:phospholipid/cholesterol/gamma-HCH transport system substrate-binding protein
MEKKEIAQQIKVGAFVLAGLTFFLISVFFVGSQNNLFSKTFTVAAVFRNVEGLKAGDNVWLSGVKIGTVSDVQIVEEGKVIVLLSLKENQNRFIKSDAVATIATDGFVGSKIVIIRPGKSNMAVAEEDTLNTTAPTDTQDLMNLAKDVGDNTRSLTSDLKMIAHRLNTGKGIVGELLNDGATAQELRTAIQNLSATGSNTAKASAELHSLIYELHNGDGLLPMLVADTGYAKTFQNAMENIEKFSVNAGAVSESLETLAAKINNSNNAIGVLLSDSVAATQLRNTIENAENASNKLDDNMEALQHNFLFRGYFRKQEKRQARDAKEAASARGE